LVHEESKEEEDPLQSVQWGRRKKRKRKQDFRSDPFWGFAKQEKKNPINDVRKKSKKTHQRGRSPHLTGKEGGSRHNQEGKAVQQHCQEKEKEGNPTFLG